MPFWNICIKFAFLIYRYALIKSKVVGLSADGNWVVACYKEVRLDDLKSFLLAYKL